MTRSTWEKIILASIPIIGGIIIALIQIYKPDPIKPKPSELEPESINISKLKNKAGEINDMVVFKRYSDLQAVMNDGLKASITKNVFNTVQDSIHKNLGDFIKPIDTTYSSAFGNINIYVKNQYQKGVNINQIIFDKEGTLFGLFATTTNQ